ncbi:hypothetical protein LPJ75_006500, partial [Coemansia sp. RSA 2598]
PAAQRVSPLHTGSDAVDRTIRQLLGSEDSKHELAKTGREADSGASRDVGRRRAKHSTSRCNSASAPTQSKLLIRQRFSERLEHEYQSDLKALESVSASALDSASA